MNGSADKLVRAVRLAINRLHENLAEAVDAHGRPHPVLRPFGEHLAKDLIGPLARYNGRMGARTRPAWRADSPTNRRRASGGQIERSRSARPILGGFF